MPRKPIIVNSKDWTKIFESFRDKTIIVIGDVMVDSYLWGEVNRISPEAPIPIISGTRRENRPGGAANVAMNLKELGAKPVLCSVIGEDDNGNTFVDLMNTRKLGTEGIIRHKNRKTTVKTRIISQNQHLLRVDDEDDEPLDQTLEKKFTDHVLKLAKSFVPDGIIFEDYDKGVITPSVIDLVVGYANAQGIEVSADPKRRNFANYRNIALFKPNFQELTDGLNLPLRKGDVTSLFEATKDYQAGANIRYLLISLSEYGVYISDGETYDVVPAEFLEIVDVSGAGDTLVSVAMLSLLAGLDMETIARVANLAGGLVCGKTGVVPVNRDELMKKCSVL